MQCYFDSIELYYNPGGGANIIESQSVKLGSNGLYQCNFVVELCTAEIKRCSNSQRNWLSLKNARSGGKIRSFGPLILNYKWPKAQ